MQLGLHRLRLEGELTEIRGADLRFSPAEARALLEAAGVKLAEPTPEADHLCVAVADAPDSLAVTTLSIEDPGQEALPPIWSRR